MSNGKLGIGYANSAGSAAIEPNMKMSDRTHNKAPGATGRDRQDTQGYQIMHKKESYQSKGTFDGRTLPERV